MTDTELKVVDGYCKCRKALEEILRIAKGGDEPDGHAEDYFRFKLYEIMNVATTALDNH